MAGNRWRSDRWEHQSRLFGPMLPCPASVGRGGSGGAACYHRPQRHVPASGQSSQGCRRAIESIWQSPMGPMRKPTRGQPETKMRPPMRESRQSLGALSALRPAAVPGIAMGAASSGDGVRHRDRIMAGNNQNGWQPLGGPTGEWSISAHSPAVQTGLNVALPRVRFLMRGSPGSGRSPATRDQLNGAEPTVPGH